MAAVFSMESSVRSNSSCARCILAESNSSEVVVIGAECAVIALSCKMKEKEVLPVELLVDPLPLEKH